MSDTKKAVLYCRSASTDNSAISLQENSLRAFADEKGIIITGVYSDNGKSGSTTDRPAFNALMLDIKNGDVDCIITKDFARISRSFIQVGEWLDSMSGKGVRVISVSERFDSFALGGDMAEAFVATFRKAYNEALSAKIKTGIAYRREKESAKRLAANIG
jgi:DNA invertase Pin-like site-specific DNA recombinase